MMNGKPSKRDFFIKIILPTLLAFSLFTISIFFIIIPAFQQIMLDKKREVIKELTNSAWSILEEFDQKVKEGTLSKEEAQEEAKVIVEYLRYGNERKDYFWITDMRPFMIVHPYRSELNNTDLSNYTDSADKKLFVEFVKVVKSDGEGFVDYMWQWKDDSTKIVSKLSYVKQFKPWDWIIGTGIYIEDVNEEIALLTRNLIYLSLSILLLLGLILAFVGHQSLNIEKLRLKAEQGLRESEAKFRTLVEASTEGLVMLLEGEYVYVNKALLRMLGYDDLDSEKTNIEEILFGRETIENEDTDFFRKLKNGILQNRQVESYLYNKSGEKIDAIFYTSEISLGDKKGYSIIVQDITSHKKLRDEFGEKEEKYQTLINNINLGLFRISLGRNGKFIEANSSLLGILGFGNRSELFESSLFDLFEKKQDQKLLYKELLKEGHLKNSVIKLRKKTGEIAVISLSALLIKDENNKPIYCDGIIEDVSEKIKINEGRENLILELQTSLHFLNEPVVNFLKKAIECGLNESISNVAKKMTKSKYSAALIVKETGEYLGVITDHDLRKRVIADNFDIDKSVFEVMSAPIISIPSNSLVFQALNFMNEKSVRHLAVRNTSGEILGLISSEELLKVHTNSSTYLIREIENASTVNDVILSQDKLPLLLKTLIHSGVKIQYITQIVTSIFDTTVKKLLDFALLELGEPPVKFVFIALGSGGRKELTLISDQDNAIIFEDVTDDKKELVESYFIDLAQNVCKRLNDCGYSFCKGEAMARNPKWSQPLSKWKEYFHKWITNSEPQDLIDVSIFFDFRPIYGERELSANLRNYIFEKSEGQAGFYQHLVKNSLLHKPPIGILGNIILESKGEHPETFDLKAATMPIIDFARIYSLKYKLKCTGTIERLNELSERGFINKTAFNELIQAYNFLMQMRFKHHAAQIESGAELNNHINPKDFSQIEQNTLKNAFSQILGIQKKLNFDYSGEAL